METNTLSAAGSGEKSKATAVVDQQRESKSVALAGAVGWWMPEVLGLGEKTMQSILDYQICVLVGMGALIASVIGAPLATILIVFELTGNYQAAT